MAMSTPRPERADPGRLVRWELASSRANQAVLAGAWGAHAGFWLGLMGDADLAEATDAFYRTTPRWRDDSFVRGGLAPWEAAAVQAWFPPAGRVLVPSAGAAREMLPLAAMGYEVVGFDPSPPLVDFGNHLLTATDTAGTLVHSNASAVPEGLDGPFDAVHFGWGGISHVRWRGTRVAMLRSVRGLCADGAPMLISFLTRPPDSRRFHVARSVATAVGRLRGDRRAIELGDTVDGSFDHYFTFDEMESELTEAGFTTVARVPQPYAHVVAAAS